MHLPSNGSLGGVVGEELLEWLNTNFIAPDSDEAIELSRLSAPWTEDSFWHYLIRSVLSCSQTMCNDSHRCVLRGLLPTASIFLEGLKKHPSTLMSHQADTLINVLSSHPRSNSFDTEQEFFYTWRQWKSKIAGFRKKLELISDQDGGDWLPWLLEIAHIIEGDKATILRYCESYEEGWKEAICVWGIWVDIGLRRQNIP